MSGSHTFFLLKRARAWRLGNDRVAQVLRELYIRLSIHGHQWEYKGNCAPRHKSEWGGKCG